MWHAASTFVSSAGLWADKVVDAMQFLGIKVLKWYGVAKCLVLRHFFHYLHIFDGAINSLAVEYMMRLGFGQCLS